MFFMIKYAHAFDMRFIGRVLHNFTFHDNFAHFSYVHGLSRDAEENHANHVPCIPHAPYVIKICID